MSSNAALGALTHATSGSIGTALSAAAGYPLDLVTTRLKAQNQRLQRSGQEKGPKGEQKEEGNEPHHYNGVIDALYAIVTREGGLTALYSGIGADVTKSIIDSFLFFGFYTYLRPKRRSGGKGGSGGQDALSSRQRTRLLVEELARGALAGACARLITTPVSNVVTRKQVAADGQPRSLREIVREIREEGGGGWLSLWSGYSATLVLTLNPSITFLVNRRLDEKVLPALEDEDVPAAWAGFLLAAISKAVATAVTYPFQTGKTRLQVSGGAVKATGNDEKGEQGREETGQSKTKLAWARRVLDQTIFGVILRIIREEGVTSLYGGIQGELFKGFFSHGMTMLTKGQIHKIIIRLSLMVAARQKRLRSAART